MRRAAPTRRDILMMAGACAVVLAMPGSSLAKKPKKRKVVHPLAHMAKTMTAARKKAKKAADSPERRKAVLALFDEYEALIATTAQQRAEHYRELVRTVDSAKSMAEFEPLFEQQETAVKSFYSKLTDLALRLREQLTDDEWQAVYALEAT